MATNYASLTKQEVEKVLSTNILTGLSSKEVIDRQKIHGPNSFGEGSRFSFLRSALLQLTNPLVLVLVFAGVVSFLLKDTVDLLVILAAIILNLFIGLLQEKRADDAFLKLSLSQQKIATVLREGRKKTIKAEDLVKGDIVFLENGMLVPADIRILEENDLKIEESVLTGEWVPSDKESIPQKPGQPITLQRNMAFMGTAVVSGSGFGIAVRTGKHTEVGKIASSISSIGNVRTPLERNIKRISKVLLGVTFIAAIAIFALGLSQGKEFREIFMTAVAVAVSVVPEGLPAAVTVVLALGMERTLRKGGLVKNLMAAETLGSTTVILTDKTGTLTEGRMKVSQVYTLDYALSKYIDVDDQKAVLRGAVLASDAFIEESDKSNEEVFTIHGRPVEKAIVRAGLDVGFNQGDLNKNGEKRLDFVAFNSTRRYMASLNETLSWPNKIYFSGEPEKILASASSVYRKGEARALSSKWRESLEVLLQDCTKRGLRLTAVAYKDVSWKKIPEDKEVLSDVVFLGFLAFTDPVRQDVKESIAVARNAGVRVLMLTGDHPETALQIAKDSGIALFDAPIILGKDIDDLSDKEIYSLTKSVFVFARVLPQHKLRICQVLRDFGEVVAMTGDGVNDAPALRSADIGVAVASGTDVAKGASDLILIENSFSVITKAIEEGRRIVDNLRKVIGFLLATSFGEVLLILIALLYALPLPILPAQILWLNILGEGLFNFAYAFEEKENGLMKRKPTGLSEGIMTKDLKKLVLVTSVATSIFLFSLYFLFLWDGLSIGEIRTLMFVAVSISAMLFSLSFKSITLPIWNVNFIQNKHLIAAFALSFFALVLSFNIPIIRDILQLESVKGSYLFIIFVFAALNLIVIEIIKSLFISNSEPVLK